MKNFLGVPFFSILALTLAVGSHAKVEYHLNKVENPSADELDAYERITAAMDSAVYMYNKYTHMSKHIEVHYNTGVQTADASFNGTMRFGSNRSYMRVRTAMHEMGHTMGMGTTSEYTAMIKDNVFQGEIAQAKLKELTGDPTAVLKGDSQHFWPYGLNYDSELHSEEDLIIHCQVVEAMYQDIFKEAFFKEGRLRSVASDKCMGITATNGLEMMDCSKEGTIVKLFSIGDNPVAYRIELGDRVLDVPNESTAAGVVLGTYYWNAGSHQKVYLENANASQGAPAGAMFLQNSKSRLYLEASGTQVVQNSRGADSKPFLWILDSLNTQASVPDTLPPADTTAADTVVSDTAAGDTAKTDAIYRHMEKRYNYTAPVRKFDVRGRLIPADRNRPRFMKEFSK